MKTNNSIFNLKTLFFLGMSALLFNACNNDDDKASFEETRLFRPVLNEELYSEGNTIIVDMGKLKEAIGYTLEVSRDTFATVEYTIETDTNYVEINEDLTGQELFWNTLYQVRATAHASDPEYDSKMSDFGGVRTERFPTILNIPEAYDVTDVAARVSWTVAGAVVTGIKVFAADDLYLEDPLFDETPVSEEEQQIGESFVEGLSPETEYQIAIYSEEEIRGWVNYTTKVPDIDPTAPNVIDVRDDESRDAVANAMASAPDGSIILVKRGMEYDAPSVGLDKSVTIRAAYGFEEQKARLLFDGNFDLVSGANIDHLRFVDLELRGTDWEGKYVINISQPGTLEEMSFENCYITNFRGVFRAKTSDVTVNNYVINNSIVDSINGYGIASLDDAGSFLNNIKLTKSTVNHTIYFLVSKNNAESVLIEDCTLANITESGRQMLRWREGGQDNITNGVVIRNSIIGHAWDTAMDESYAIRGIEGLSETFFDVSNTYTVSDFSWDSDPIPNIIEGNAGSSQEELWVDPENNDFNFEDSGFPGKYDSGDPRWRAEL